jgi:hypothetical protein
VPFLNEPENHDREVHLPASAIRPYPLPRVVFLLFALVLGLAFLGTGIGTAIALTKANDVKHQIETKSDQRDKEHAATEAQIKALALNVKTRQERDRAAVCLAVSSALAKDPVRPDPILTKLATDYACGNG